GGPRRPRRLRGHGPARWCAGRSRHARRCGPVRFRAVTTAVPQIAVDDLAARHSDGALIVDVRMPDEYAAGHVPGAVLMPLPEVPDRAGELPSDVPVYVICRSGARSQRAS